MPYTIIVCDDNSLYGSRKRKIMQREKLFNKLQILVPPCYNGYDMSQCTVTMRYLLPISKEFRTETLLLSEERYEEYLKYTLPIDSYLTKEWGDIELNLTFILLDADNDGNVVQHVRKTGNHILHITKIPDWDSVVPDSSLAAIDQRIIAQSAQIKALEALAESFSENQVNDLIYDDANETLQLSANGVGVGTKVSVREMLDDGIPIVNLDSTSSDSGTTDNDNDSNCNCGCEDNVVEFDEVVTTENVEDDNVVEF